MDFDFELEDILASLKAEKKNTEDASAEKPAVSAEEPAPAAPHAPEPLAPPKPLAREQQEEPAAAPAKKARQKKEKAAKAPKEKKIKTPKEKPVKQPKEKAPKVPREPAPPRLRFSTVAPRPVLVILIAAVAVLAVFGCIRIGQNMRLKSYERQYQMAFPKGFAVEHCKDYAKNRDFAGYLTLGDSDDTVTVYAGEYGAAALLQKGSDVLAQGQFLSMDLSDTELDIEALYATPEKYQNASQSVLFDSLFGKETYRVIAAYHTNTKPEDDNGYVFPYNAYGTMTEASLKEYNNRVKSRRLYDTGFTIKNDDTVLILSRDSDWMPAAKFVVVAVKVKGKVTPSSKADENTNIHYPQAYYDKTGKKNNYFLAGKWYPEIITDEGTKQLTASDFEH